MVKIGPVGFGLHNPIKLVARVNFGQDTAQLKPYETDVVLIGAGIGSFVAMDQLNEADKSHQVKAVMLEEQDRIGGNARTYYDENNNPYPGGSTVIGVDGDVKLTGLLDRLNMRPTSKNLVYPGYVSYPEGPLKGTHSFDLYKPGKTTGDKQVAVGINDAVEKMREHLGYRTIGQGLDGGSIKIPFPTHQLDRHTMTLDKKDLLSYASEHYPHHVVQFIDAIARSDTGVGAEHNSALSGIVDHTLYINNGNDFWIYPGGNYTIIKNVLNRVKPSIDGVDNKRFTIQTKRRVTKIEDHGQDGVTVHYEKTDTGQKSAIRAKRVILDVPPHRLSQLMDLPADTRQKLSSIKQSGPYGIVNLFFDEAVMPLNKFVIVGQDPGEHKPRLWTTDFVATSVQGDCQTPVGTKMPTVITAYAPIPQKDQQNYPKDEKQFIQRVVDEIAGLPKLAYLKDKIKGSRLTMYPEGIAYVEPGGVQKIRSLNPFLTSNVRYIHSGIAGGGAVSAARGALWEGMAGAEDILKSLNKPVIDANTILPSHEYTPQPQQG